jgi:hypothetical protein
MKTLVLATALLAGIPVLANAHPDYVNGVRFEDCRSLAGYRAVLNHWVEDPENINPTYPNMMIALMRAILAEHAGWGPIDVLRRCGFTDAERIWSLAQSFSG